MAFYKLNLKWLLVIISFSTLAEQTISQSITSTNNDMCGDWNLGHTSTLKEKQFQCENKISLQIGGAEHGTSIEHEGSGFDSGLEEDWPWIGTLTDTDNPDRQSLGVVVAPDIVITDLTLQDVDISQLRFTLKTGFEASILSSLVKLSPDLLVITLGTSIPSDQFRPVCVPPQDYITRVIKTNSCQNEASKLVKVKLHGENGISRSTENIINENTCGKQKLQSKNCTVRMMSNTENCLKPDGKFLNSHYNIIRGSESSTDYYTCHRNVLKAREQCELDVLEVEARCKDTPVAACSVFLKKGDTKRKKNLCVPEINKMANCIVNKFGNSTYPFQGVNCLHSFLPEMPSCAVHDKKPGLKSLGKEWGHDPCKTFPSRRERIKCYRKPENKWLRGKPYTKNWSLSMVKQVNEFGSCILEETECTSCGEEGKNLCTSREDLENESPGPDFLFWFDSCRDKWFFLGPSKQSTVGCEKSIRIYPDMEIGAESIRSSISAKVPEIDLYPRPIIVVLGPTGVGKSTTANTLISGHASNSKCFSTGGGTKSKTKKTSWKMGKWLGVGKCVTLVDTPGTDDTSGPHQDYENIKELMNTLKYDLKNIDVFLVMFREPNLRFVESMRKALDLFVSIFGETFWNNVVTEFTFAGFSVTEIRQRYERTCNECKKMISSSSDSYDGYNDYDKDYNDDQIEENSLVIDGKCSILAADAVNGSDFFKNGSLENEGWDILQKDPKSGQQAYWENCGWSSNSFVYDKADYVARKIKEIDWNAAYSSFFKVLEEKKIPSTFIHPVYDQNDKRQCQAFKRESSKLWNLIGTMSSFKCSEKCEAPDSYFLGAPHIFSDPVIFAKQNSPFSISCNVWNGVELTGLMEKDINWFHGWKLLEIDGVKWTSSLFPKSHSSKSSENITEIELILHQAYSRDAGLYSCVLPGVKDIEDLKFEESARLDKDTIENTIESTNGDILCSLPMTESDFKAKQHLIQWYQAREIDSKHGDSVDFSTNLVKQADQFAISKLTLKRAKEDQAGTYACKSLGGYSNEVSLKIKIDAIWTSWGAWSSCSQKCTNRLGHHGSKSQRRTCSPAVNSDVTCDQLEGSDISTAPCGTICCPTNGTFLNWQSWGPCSKTCSNIGETPGTKTKTRSCTPPSSAPCPGEPCDDRQLQEHLLCNSHSEKPCPINGGYSSWSEWSGCKFDPSASRCSGMREKTCLCNNPAPKYGGLPCEGATGNVQVQKEFCEPTCPEPCECDLDWPEEWGACNQTCGNCGDSFCNEGSHMRRRVCIKETCVEGKCGETCLERYGGAALVDYKVCNISHCEIDGVWKSWSEWSDCDVNTGTQFRTRQCTPPKFGGNDCNGSSKQVKNCPVDCQCDGIAWGEMSSCPVTCGEGIKMARRGCRSSLNGGRKCTKNEEEKQEICVKKRCPVISKGTWGKWGDYSNCTANCGGGHQERYRSCTFKETIAMGDDFDEDYDIELPCSGTGMENTGPNTCNNQVCSISTLVFAMDTSGSFSGTDRNSAYDLARGMLKGLAENAIQVPKYQLVEVNDPEVNKGSPTTNKKSFESQLYNLYGKSHPSGGDWAERSFKALAKPYALDAAPHRAVLCLFTDAGTHDLNKQREIIKLRDEKEIQIFIFLTPDYNIYSKKWADHEVSYRAYQAISRRHTYIMSDTNPITILNLVMKYLKNIEPECVTQGGPKFWIDIPNECQFPFTYKNVTYTSCTSVDSNQPWCSTVTGAHKEFLVDKWGYCGDCSGAVNPQCINYKTLSDSWRKVSPDGHSRRQDDSKITRGWYRFNVGGAGKIPTSPPTGSGNGAGNDICGTGGVGWMAGDLPTHIQKEVERKFCFESDSDCDHFKMLNVLWCPDGDNPPFYIYELKPTEKDFGYCIVN